MKLINLILTLLLSFTAYTQSSVFLNVENRETKLPVSNTTLCIKQVCLTTPTCGCVDFNTKDIKKRAGQSIRIKVIPPEGLVVMNSLALNTVVRTEAENDHYEVIYLCRPAVRERLGMAYYRARLNLKLLADYENKRKGTEAFYEKLLNNQNLSLNDKDELLQEKRNNIARLEKDLATAKAQNKTLAQQIMQTDLETASAIYQKALTYLAEGQPDKVIALLPDDDLSSKADSIKQELERIDKRKSILLKAQKELALTYLTKGQAYSQKLQLDSTEYYFLQAYKQDSLNYEVLFSLGSLVCKLVKNNTS